MTEKHSIEPEAESVWPVKIKLSKSIKAHGKIYQELELREPCFGDVCDIISVKISENSAQPDFAKLPLLVSRLANIPESSAERISIVDFPAFVEVFLSALGKPNPLSRS